jgi:YVTN family beta-propeller protein
VPRRKGSSLAALTITAGIAALLQCRPSPEVPGLVYVSNADSDSVSVIDPATLTVIATLSAADISVSGNEPRNLAASPDRTVVCVPFRFSGNVLVVDPFVHEFTTVVTDASFDEPYAVAFTAGGGEAWVVNKQGGGSSTGSITVVDTGTHAVITTIADVHFSSPEGIAIAAGKAYIANRGNGTVSVVSVATRAWLEDIGAAVYVFDPQTDTVILDGLNPLAIPVGSTPRAILGL